MERIFMLHFADAAELGMPFDPIFIGDSAFVVLRFSQRKGKAFPACFTSVIAIRSGKCCTTITTSNIFQSIFFFPVLEYDWIVCYEGNRHKILKEARKICIFGKIYWKIWCASFRTRYAKWFFSACAICITILLLIHI